MRLFTRCLAVLVILSVAPAIAQEAVPSPPAVTFHLAVDREACQETLEAITAAFPDFDACVDRKGDGRHGMLPTVEAQSRDKVARILAEAETQDLIPDAQMLLLNKRGEGNTEEDSLLYCVNREPDFTILKPEDVIVSPNEFDEGHWQIYIELDQAGGKALGKLTAAHINEVLAIVYDKEVLSAPVIRDRITTNCVITGDFTREEAEKIAAALKANTQAKE